MNNLNPIENDILNGILNDEMFNDVRATYGENDNPYVKNLGVAYFQYLAKGLAQKNMLTISYLYGTSKANRDMVIRLYSKFPKGRI